MPTVEIGQIESIVGMVERGWPGKVLTPVPRAQAQEGPNCGFYALSIVMEYWKARGAVAEVLPARKRDTGVPRDDPDYAGQASLRQVGKVAGALDLGDPPRASTGGVFTAEQLAVVARAADFSARVATKRNSGEFQKLICDILDLGIPVIVAFDVERGDPVAGKGGQASHWGVVFGYYRLMGTLYYVATHGHGKYYLWDAESLKNSNFGLAGTVRHLGREVKTRLLNFTPPQDNPRLGQLARPHWAGSKELLQVKDLKARHPLFKDVTVASPTGDRPAVDVVQDLAYHIVCVFPAARV